MGKKHTTKTTKTSKLCGKWKRLIAVSRWGAKWFSARKQHQRELDCVREADLRLMDRKRGKCGHYRPCYVTTRPASLERNGRTPHICANFFLSCGFVFITRAPDGHSHKKYSSSRCYGNVLCRVFFLVWFGLVWDLGNSVARSWTTTNPLRLKAAQLGVAKTNDEEKRIQHRQVGKQLGDDEHIFIEGAECFWVFKCSCCTSRLRRWWCIPLIYHLKIYFQCG